MTRAEAEAKLRAFIRQRVDRSKAKSRVEITESITYAVQDWLRWMGAVSSQREVPISYEMDDKRLKGRIDVVGQWNSGARMAVEIDHEAKPRSRRKLEVLKQGGWRVAWVRWDDVQVEIDEYVPCVWVHATATRHMRRKESRKRQVARLRLISCR